MTRMETTGKEEREALVAEARVRTEGLRKIASNAREAPGDHAIIVKGEKLDGVPLVGSRITGPAADALIASAKLHGENAEFITRLADALAAARGEADIEERATRVSLATLHLIEQAIRDYHFALDNREHGGVAAGKAIDAIEELLGRPWRQGEETALRSLKGQTP